MNSRLRKIISLSALVFFLGFIGAFLGKNFEKTKLRQKLEKKLGIKEETKGVEAAAGSACVQQQEEEDNSALFVGCNGFF